jgi:hypothetical protein
MRNLRHLLHSLDLGDRYRLTAYALSGLASQPRHARYYRNRDYSTNQDIAGTFAAPLGLYSLTR